MAQERRERETETGGETKRQKNRHRKKNERRGRGGRGVEETKPQERKNTGRAMLKASAVFFNPTPTPLV